MSANHYKNGRPPHIGWWFTENDGMFGSVFYYWRWWNGARWSAGLTRTASKRQVTQQSAKGSGFVRDIRWSNYWPKGARVPRIDPEHNHHQVMDGVEFYPSQPDSVMKCCNCGSEHRVKYRVFYVFERKGKKLRMVPLEDDGRYQVGVTAWAI